MTPINRTSDAHLNLELARPASTPVVVESLPTTHRRVIAVHSGDHPGIRVGDVVVSVTGHSGEYPGIRTAWGKVHAAQAKRDRKAARRLAERDRTAGDPTDTTRGTP
jgi:hypothetical protein